MAQREQEEKRATGIVLTLEVGFKSLFELDFNEAAHLAVSFACSCLSHEHSEANLRYSLVTYPQC